MMRKRVRDVDRICHVLMVPFISRQPLA